jgi:serine/threonine protein kinase
MFKIEEVEHKLKPKNESPLSNLPTNNTLNYDLKKFGNNKRLLGKKRIYEFPNEDFINKINNIIMMNDNELNLPNNNGIIQNERNNKKNITNKNNSKINGGNLQNNESINNNKKERGNTNNNKSTNKRNYNKKERDNTNNNKSTNKRKYNKKERDNSNTNSNTNNDNNNDDKQKAKRNNSNRIEWDKIISNSHNNKIVYDSVINNRKHKIDKAGNNVNNDNINTATDNSLKNSEVTDNSKTPISCGDYIYYEKFQIGVGSFGKVFCGKNKTTNNKVAIKVPNDDKVNKAASDQEIRYTKMMEKEQGFPILYHTYLIDKKSIIIESLLGPSLDKLFTYCGRKFPLKTICSLGIQLIRRLQSMHKLGLIHRDLKPNNFSWGNFTNNINIQNNNMQNGGIDLNTIFLIDFGLSCPYMNLNNGKLYNSVKGFQFVGTLRYSSLNSHMGIRLCRKDDLESLMYILIYLYKGRLPWQDIKAKEEKEKFRKIKEKKMMTSSVELCKNMPDEFEKMVSYIKNLRFDEFPNYNRLINGLKLIMEGINEEQNLEGDFDYIWEKKLYDDYILVNSSDGLKKNIIYQDIENIFKGYPSDIIKLIEEYIKNIPKKLDEKDGKQTDEKNNDEKNKNEKNKDETNKNETNKLEKNKDETNKQEKNKLMKKTMMKKIKMKKIKMKQIKMKQIS